MAETKGCGAAVDRTRAERIELIAGLPAKEKHERLRAACRHTDVGHRIMAFYLAELDERRECQLLSCSSTIHYAVTELGLDRTSAWELIRAGRKLCELARIDAAFCEGRIPWSKVRALVAVATPETEDAWLERALALTSNALRAEVARARNGRPPGPGAKGLPEVRLDVKLRFSTLDHEVWEQARRKVAAETGEPIDDSGFAAWLAHQHLSRRPDGSLPGWNDEGTSAFRVSIGLCRRCDEAEMHRDEGPEPLGKETLESVLCDAETAGGELAPKTPPSLRRRVLARDGHRCRVCRGTWRLMVHHVTWRSEGGATSAENCATLCGRCHALVHEGLLVISGEAPHRLRFLRADGTPLGEGGEAVRPIVRKIGVESDVPGGEAKASRVTFKDLGPVMDAGRWSRIGHLFQWNERKGLLEFEAGEEQEVEAPAESEPAEGPAEVGLEGIVGQEEAKRLFARAAAAARREGRTVPHCLIDGPAGTGKTTFARAIAAEMGTEARIANAPLIRDAVALVTLFLSAARGSIIFIDEIHALPVRLMEMLYEALQSGALTLLVTDGRRTKSVRFELQPVTIVAATTEAGSLTASLRERFPIRQTLEPYAEEELAAVVTERAEASGLGVTRGAAAMLAGVAHGIPREALGLLVRAHDEAVNEGEEQIDEATVRRTLAAAGIDHLGLNRSHRLVLRTLLGHGLSRAMGLHRLEAMTRIDTRTLRDVIEPPLLRLGLMTTRVRGRAALPEAARLLHVRTATGMGRDVATA